LVYYTSIVIIIMFVNVQCNGLFRRAASRRRLFFARSQIASYFLEKGRHKSGKTSERRLWWSRFRSRRTDLLPCNFVKGLVQRLGTGLVHLLDRLVRADGETLKSARIRQPLDDDFVPNVIRYLLNKLVHLVSFGSGQL
jgi:hypothetical protein